MTELILASNNRKKIAELETFFRSASSKEISVRTLRDIGWTEEIAEDGESFEENSLIKAMVPASLGKLGTADDSGLSVDALGGAPGIYSARYLGKDTSYDIKNKNLIERVDASGSGNRTARFVCAIAAVFPDGLERVVRGTVEGEIARKPAGSNGFGFDPIFFLPERGCTTAELEPCEKHALSHRGNALRLMREVIKEHEDTYNK